ncbi:16S rRNA (guanine(966)-N(2))-methyltransferase RsmD [Helicobacter sp. 16-1353]|uniref:16S rRNA (guanine(966)-N(2))-methyltransferase RsmD n=1 Tax=Helicobacter sp. 16-1353 TaxID=2004996 RepID=UPI000DCF5693|nr:16S rRNA (guanine(966)-N(2))-methyltransferase RsmD [Helicobacter sp. 16-1353]RAX55258.1 16S rRNA (guanine(966)-N(2))-methyltransferase RsmD [Helicobacter sp. 16-1353]
MQSKRTTNKVKSSIKIIGGKYKGKVLNMDILPNTRPTKAIVRESLFNTLQNFIQDKVFLEVFAGYGSIGFEAFSRGAKKVIFIEKDILAFKILDSNINLFKQSLENLRAYNKDSIVFLSGLLATNNIDILYFDPPFGTNGEYYYKCFNILENTNLKDKMIIFEHISNFVMPQNIGDLPLNKYRKFGKTSISYYHKN